MIKNVFQNTFTWTPNITAQYEAPLLEKIHWMAPKVQYMEDSKIDVPLAPSSEFSPVVGLHSGLY